MTPPFGQAFSLVWQLWVLAFPIRSGKTSHPTDSEPDAVTAVPGVGLVARQSPLHTEILVSPFSSSFLLLFLACSWEYYVNDAPRIVLNKLESCGYRVVSMTGVGQTLVWCLHKE